MCFPLASPVRKSQLWTLSVLNSFQPIIFPRKGCEIVAFKMLKVFQCFRLESFQTSPSQMVALLRNQPLLNQEMMQSILFLRRISGGDSVLLWDRFLYEQEVLIFLLDLKITFLSLPPRKKTLCCSFSSNIYKFNLPYWKTKCFRTLC